MTLRKRTGGVLVALIALIVLVTLCGQGGAEEPLRSLMERRTATIWYEGQVLGELILGARAKFTFVYVDGKLTEQAWKNSETPEWIQQGTGAYGTDLARKKRLFIIRVETNKNLHLEPSMITIGSHVLTWEDILTNKTYVPMGDVPPGFTAAFTAAIPASAVKGASVPITVGTYSAELKMP